MAVSVPGGWRPHGWIFRSRSSPQVSPDEAAHETLAAVTSGVLVPSNYWRAVEVIDAVEAARVPGVAELREAYRELCLLSSRPSAEHFQ